MIATTLTRGLEDAPTKHKRLIAWVAEIAALLPQLDSLHRSLLSTAARDMAQGHRRTA